MSDYLTKKWILKKGTIIKLHGIPYVLTSDIEVEGAAAPSVFDPGDAPRCGEDQAHRVIDFSLHVERDSDGKFSATISGIGDDGREFSARSPNNDEAKVAVARAARLVSLHHPLFGTNLESPAKDRS